MNTPEAQIDQLKADLARVTEEAERLRSAYQETCNAMEYPEPVMQGDQTPPEHAASLLADLAAVKADAERLDWLERMANENGGILLHDGSEQGRLGLGLRPGTLKRTLRSAIDAARKESPRPLPDPPEPDYGDTGHGHAERLRRQREAQIERDLP